MPAILAYCYAELGIPSWHCGHKLLLVLGVPAEDELAHVAGYTARCFYCLKAVTHPTTTRIQSRVNFVDEGQHVTTTPWPCRTVERASGISPLEHSQWSTPLLDVVLQ